MKTSLVVLLHVSCGRELALKPGLNIIGMLQPLGPSVEMSDMPDMVVMSGLDVPVGDAVLVSVGMESDIDIELCSDLLRMLIDESMEIKAVVVDVGIGMSLFEVSDMDGIDIVESIGTESCGSFATSDCIPSPGPACSTFWGRHRTLPCPLARRLSTH